MPLSRLTSLAAIPVFLLLSAPAGAADDQMVERLATCQDSWLDWKNDNAVQLKDFGEHFQSAFMRKDNDPFFVPRTRDAIAGLRITRVFPESVGMGVGFSVMLDATFDRAKQRLEHIVGKPLVKCETGDGMRTCELDIAEKRTFMLMATDGAKDSSTLAGCYYFYEK
jgi:hypothetical protein